MLQCRLPPSSLGDQGPSTLNGGTAEGALCLSGSRSCKERKGRSCCLGMSRVAKYSRAALCPSLLLPLHCRPRLLVVSASQPAACLPPSLSPPGQPPPPPSPPQAPSPPPGPHAEPQQGQPVSGAEQAGLLLPGEPGGVGSGQVAAEPGARAELQDRHRLGSVCRVSR